MDNNTFSYQYSAQQRHEIESIRKKYLPAGVNKMERLRMLDGKVQRAGMIESLCLGIIGVLVFGLAMCFGLNVFEAAWWPAIPLGIIGTLLMIPAYPLCKYIYRKRKEELTPEILQLTEELGGK